MTDADALERLDRIYRALELEDLPLARTLVCEMGAVVRGEGGEWGAVKREQAARAEAFAMPWGKHRGRTLAEIAAGDYQYLLWLRYRADDAGGKVRWWVTKYLKDHNPGEPTMRERDARRPGVEAVGAPATAPGRAPWED